MRKSFLFAGIQLAVVVMALATSGCATSKAAKTDENVFAAYPLEDILDAGDKALAGGENERAVFIYLQALEIEKNSETWFRIGVGKSRLGDKAYAWKALKESVALDPEHAGAHEELGLVYMSMGQPEVAAQHLVRACELDPKRWRSWNALGVLADIEKRHNDAIDNYQAGLIGNPDSPLLMNNIGYSNYLSGDLQEASRWYGRAMQAAPHYQPAVMNLALLYARQGWYDEAVKTFSKVVSKPQSYNDVGYIAMRNGDLEKAGELLAEAIRLSPVYYEKAYKNLAALNQEINALGKAKGDNSELINAGQMIFPDGMQMQGAEVSVQILNVREAPSADSKIINYLRSGDHVEIIMSVPGWSFVSVRPLNKDANLTGWVNRNYLEPVATEPMRPPAHDETPLSGENGLVCQPDGQAQDSPQEAAACFEMAATTANK